MRYRDRDPVAAAWMVRAGREGEREWEALETSLVIAGWPELGDLSNIDTRAELYATVRTSFPDRSRMVVANWTGQLWRLLRIIEVDDFVVTPLKSGQVAIGRVSGGYQYRPDTASDWRHVRPVVWLQTALPRSAIRQDLLHSMGSLLTICQLRRHGAARRIAALAETGTDPGPTPEELSSNGWVTPDELLAQAAATDNGLELTIREFLAKWGAGRRTSSAVAAIQRDLSESGLTTVPPFTEGSIDSSIRLIRSGASADESTDDPESMAEGDEGPVLADDAGDELVPDRPFTLRFGTILPSGAAVTSVQATDSIVLARTLMLRHNYSQLAVVDDKDALHGAITWESIAQAQMAHQNASTVAQAKHAAPTAAYDELVLPRIDEISSRGFMFVRSRDGQTVAGIITAADLAIRFGEIAKPFTMIEECERRLYRRVKAEIPPDVIAATTNHRHKSADTLTLGAYVRVLTDEKNFQLLSWPLDHGEFVSQVKKVADIRNQMMHFSPDPIPTDEWGAIDGLLAMLHAVDPLP